MKVLILYRPNSERSRAVEEFLHEFQRVHSGKKIEALDIDTKEGADLTRLYDITDQPAILATRDDGSVVQIWQGRQLPLMGEVAAYTQ